MRIPLLTNWMITQNYFSTLLVFFFKEHCLQMINYWLVKGRKWKPIDRMLTYWMFFSSSQSKEEQLCGELFINGPKLSDNIKFKHISPSSVVKTIQKLKVYKACWPDNIQIYINYRSCISFKYHFQSVSIYWNGEMAILIH